MRSFLNIYSFLHFQFKGELKWFFFQTLFTLSLCSPAVMISFSRLFTLVSRVTFSSRSRCLAPSSSSNCSSKSWEGEKDDLGIRHEQHNLRIVVYTPVHVAAFVFSHWLAVHPSLPLLPTGPLVPPKPPPAPAYGWPVVLSSPRLRQITLPLPEAGQWGPPSLPTADMW